MARVLDIGAGYEPHPAATDAIDILDRKTLASLGKQDGYVIPSRLLYKFGVDFNQALPYPAGTFQRAISRFSLATFGKPPAYREAHRVLRPGGSIEIWAGDSRKIARITRHLRGARFTGVAVEDLGQEEYRITARKPLPRP